MKKFVKTVCFLLTLIALSTLVLAPATAHASPPTVINGTLTVGSIEDLDVHYAGGNIIMKQIEYGNVAGDVVGPYTFERTVIIHSNGEVNVHGFVTIDPANLLGKFGTYTMRADGRVVEGTIQIQWAIVSGTGDLANLHGQGTYTGIAGVSGTYAGQIHFDPD